MILNPMVMTLREPKDSYKSAKFHTGLCMVKLVSVFIMLTTKVGRMKFCKGEANTRYWCSVKGPYRTLIFLLTGIPNDHDAEG